jgi:hypothetical protein
VSCGCQGARGARYRQRRAVGAGLWPPRSLIYALPWALASAETMGGGGAAGCRIAKIVVARHREALD